MRSNFKIGVAAFALTLALAAPSAALAQSIQHGGDTYVAAPMNSGEAHRWPVMHRNNNRNNPFDTQCRSHASFLQVDPDALCGEINSADLVPAVRSNGYLYDTMTVNGGRVQGTTLYALGRDVVTYSKSVEVGDYLYVIDYYRGPDGCFNVAVKRYRKVPPRQTYTPQQPVRPVLRSYRSPIHATRGEVFTPVMQMPVIIRSDDGCPDDCCE